MARRAGPPFAWRLAVGAVNGILRWVFGWRVRAACPQPPPSPHTPLVLVFNHTSNVDAFVVADTVWRELRHWSQPLAKAELFAIPGLGALGRAAGAIPVTRDDDSGRSRAYDAAVERLRDGGTIMLAPEGTVTHDGALLPLRHGAARLALEAGVAVLVVTHLGAQRAFSPVARLPHRRALVTMAMDVLDPWEDEDAAALTGRIALTMLERSQQLLDEYPRTDADAAWLPPYTDPARPTETALANIERYRASMVEAVAAARTRLAERAAQVAAEHHLEERVAHLRDEVDRRLHRRP